MQEPHRLSAEKVLKNHETSPQQGLSTSETTRLLSLHGPNELIEKGKKKAWRILLAQVKEVKKMTVPNVRVRRDGKEQQISAKDLVPGDIVLIEAGNIVPADARLIAAANLKVQEAALTGESESVYKDAGELPDGELSLADRQNMIYRGTVVIYGRGEAVVNGTDMQTELGKIATMLQVEDEKNPLQRRLAKLGRSLAMAAGVLIIIVDAE